ncbi:MAG TPA: glycogen-binding domain-containing protein [Candidatus Krumholzibacteria bacterium]|nr:glycogen-binding domain-containing protein [Candidatus Krumholzibacteria bacterium]
MLIFGAAPVLAQKPWTPSPFLSVSGGHESNYLLDPAGAAIVVPGGSFLDLSPGIELTRRPSRLLALRLGTRATVERFFNDENRTLYGQVAWGDLFYALSPRTRLRLSLSGDYFNDTQLSTLRRFGGGGELGLSYSFRRLSLEGFLGGRGVSYPRADALNDQGLSTSYREGRLNLGLVATASLTPRVFVRGSLVTRATNSVDPLYDGNALLSDFSLRWLPRRRIRIDLIYSRQDRRFDHRTSAFDDDLYEQWGAGASYEITPGASVSLRYSEGTYTDPAGAKQDTDRIEFALRLGSSLLGTSRPTLPVAADFSKQAPPGPEQKAEGTIFRVRAPAARRVSVGGDFNGWQQDEAPMEPVGDGWWQLSLKIPPGQYQYVYFVDGKALTPPESVLQVDDGFGGVNGLLQVR